MNSKYPQMDGLGSNNCEGECRAEGVRICPSVTTLPPKEAISLHVQNIFRQLFTNHFIKSIPIHNQSFKRNIPVQKSLRNLDKIRLTIIVHPLHTIFFFVLKVKIILSEIPGVFAWQNPESGWGERMVWGPCHLLKSILLARLTPLSIHSWRRVCH